MNENETATEETVDNSAGVSEFDTAASDVIAQIEQEFADAAVDALPDAPAEETAEAAADSGEGVATEEVAAEGAEPLAEEAEEDRGLERLVAREVAVREAETKLKERESKLTEMETELTQAREKLAALPTDFIKDMGHRPWEALEEAGHDPEQVIRLCLAAKLQKDGKPLPPELRQAIRDAERDYKDAQLEKRQIEFEQRQAAAAFVAKVESDARQYVSRMTGEQGISKDAPTVAHVAKADAERVFNEILDEIGRDARARSKEPGAQLIPFDEAARRVEKRWSEMAKLFAPAGSEQASTTVGEKKSTSPAQVASKDKPAQKAVKPLIKSKPKTQKELEDEGLEAALAEYKRVEQANRPARA